MAGENPSKVTASHLKRDAYLYVRQLTLRQVFENTESTKRQYALRQRAVALSWPMDRIHLIDSDLGQSGANAADRQGFQKLVAEVSLGRAGIVLGLEVSRLARNCADWRRLLEIRALSETLILDEDGLYDPNDFNDRLLLGMKGTMSEAELHLLHARLRGGLLNKARRGELAMALPVGLVHDSQGRIVLDPDAQVRESIRMLLETFRRTGSACAVVKHYRRQHLRFPHRLRAGPGKGELVWSELKHFHALQDLHNPLYAGAYVYGRTRTHRGINGLAQKRKLPREEWDTVIRQAHEGYVSWEEYEANQRCLRENAQSLGWERQKSPPRDGPALLQGLAVCGICGKRMTVQYRTSKGQRRVKYICQTERRKNGGPMCQWIPGTQLDQAVAALLLQSLTPMALEVALSVQQEIAARIEEAGRLRARQVERARYEADLSRQRYMHVDPNNRLVADALEAEWNAKLRALTQAQEEYERQCQADRIVADDEQRKQIMALATDFPRLWNDPKTCDRDRKRMARLLIEDVTLTKKENLIAHVRFRGGTTTTLTLPRPKSSWELRQTPPETVAEIDRLLDHHTCGGIARILNERGFRAGLGGAFSRQMVRNITQGYRLRSRYDRLREAGMLTADEMACRLGVTRGTVNIWRRRGLLRGCYSNDNGYLYPAPDANAPVKSPGRKLSERRRFLPLTSNLTKEVQCAT
jgi:DNA invertase Pin-like site-specific DNA recombinase